MAFRPVTPRAGMQPGVYTKVLVSHPNTLAPRHLISFSEQGSMREPPWLPPRGQFASSLCVQARPLSLLLCYPLAPGPDNRKGRWSGNVTSASLILAQGCPAGAGGQWAHKPWATFPAHVPWVKSRACPGTNCLWCQFPGRGTVSQPVSAGPAAGLYSWTPQGLCFLICVGSACMHVKSLQLCLTLCDPMNWPGTSVHGILQARILEWVAVPSSRGSF